MTTVLTDRGLPRASPAWVILPIAAYTIHGRRVYLSLPLPRHGHYLIPLFTLCM
jgi:hypothetical protein